MTEHRTDVYVAAVDVAEIFADTTYQRPLDTARARKMADAWDRRLAGILEVSDRGARVEPRYAVLDGQHRWAAAQLLTDAPALVANVHSGLTVADEAALFDKLNRQRKQITTWDHWRARRSAGDSLVLAAEGAVAAAGLRVSEQTGSEGAVWCIGTLEKIATSPGGVDLIASTLKILTAAWGHQRAAFEAPMVHGMAMVLDTFAGQLDANRLIDALSGVPPKRIRVNASTMRDSGTPGSLAKLSATALINQYNQTAGRRLTWPKSWKGALPAKRTAQPAATGAERAARPVDTQPAGGRSGTPGDFQMVASALSSKPATVPSGLPPEQTYTDELAEAVDGMGDQPVADVAARLDVSERTVRRIRADLGYTD